MPRVHGTAYRTCGWARSSWEPALQGRSRRPGGWCSTAASWCGPQTFSSSSGAALRRAAARPRSLVPWLLPGCSSVQCGRGGEGGGGGSREGGEGRRGHPRANARAANSRVESSAADCDLAPDARAPPASVQPFAALFHLLASRSPAALAAAPPPPVHVSAPPPTPAPPHLLVEFDRRGLADVCMRVEGGEHLFLHRVFLGLASPVFRALFESPMCAARGPADAAFEVAAAGKWRVEAPEWATAAGVRAFVHYLYSGALPGCVAARAAAEVTQAEVTAAVEQLRLASFYDCPHLLQVAADA